MRFPKKKWTQPQKSRTMRVECPEDLMQGAVEEYIALKRLKNYRIPDAFFRWVIMKASPGVRKWFCWLFGGKEDNTIIYPLGNGYALALLLELKTQDIKGRAVGQTHGRQKHEEDNWRICRSVDQAMIAIDEFEKKAEEIKKILAR